MSSWSQPLPHHLQQETEPHNDWFANLASDRMAEELWTQEQQQQQQQTSSTKKKTKITKASRSNKHVLNGSSAKAGLNPAIILSKLKSKLSDDDISHLINKTCKTCCKKKNCLRLAFCRPGQPDVTDMNLLIDRIKSCHNATRTLTFDEKEAFHFDKVKQCFKKEKTSSSSSTAHEQNVGFEYPNPEVPIDNPPLCRGSYCACSPWNNSICI